MKVMYADDEESMLNLVRHIVEEAGYEFCSAGDGAEALDVFYAENPDIVILDVMMPRIDGFQVCRKLRENNVKIPIIFLSAKGDIVDKGVGFTGGGDDYIVKPFSPEELLLRVEAHLRQYNRASPLTANNVQIGDIEFDIKRHVVLVRGDRVELTPKEFHILVLLASHPGEVFTREHLIEEIWGEEFVGETSSVAVFIRKIREKIEKDPSKPKMIQTVRNVGYRFCD
jgi:two-component system response regulator VicR